MISARTKAALAAAKARGVKLGGNRGVSVDEAARQASRAVRSGRAIERASDLAPVIAAYTEAWQASDATSADPNASTPAK